MTVCCNYHSWLLLSVAWNPVRECCGILNGYNDVQYRIPQQKGLEWAFRVYISLLSIIPEAFCFDKRHYFTSTNNQDLRSTMANHYVRITI